MGKASPLACFLLLSAVVLLPMVDGIGVFRVERKFVGGKRGNMSDLRAHDSRRHSRLLAAGAADIPLGGLSLPTATGSNALSATLELGEEGPDISSFELLV